MSKLIGSILMILGTSIGAGMLALPVVTAHMNTVSSIAMLSFSWFLMTAGALAVLEVNLWLAPNTNLISMSRDTLGRWGSRVTWVIYLLLLYGLVCAYLSGISDIIQYLLTLVQIHVTRSVSTFLALALFGIIVYQGISSVDVVNRGFMALKFVAYLLLVGVAATRIKLRYLQAGGYSWHISPMMVMITSFGYAIILPSIRSYLDSNKRHLKWAVYCGSLLPLLVYAWWIVCVQGMVPRLGFGGLVRILGSDSPNSFLIHSISLQLHTVWLKDAARLFISICAVTSFLGVSICLTDFIADGLGIRKKGKPGVVVYSISYLPPLIIVLLAPGIFIQALDYAGILCILLLIMLPLSMLYVGRYIHHRENHRFLPGGKAIIIAIMLIAVVLLLLNV